MCGFVETDVLGSFQLAIHLMNKEIELSDVQLVSGKGKRNSCFQKFYEKACDLYQHQYRDTEVNKIFNGRHSYSKTYPDATCMHLKDEPMNNGQVKSTYNVQVGGSQNVSLVFNTFLPQRMLLHAFLF